MRSKRPNAALKPSRPAPDRVERHPQPEGERGRGHCVVDVVEARQRELDGDLTAGRREPESGAVHADELDLPGSHVERGPRMPTGVAAIVAEMTDVRGRVHVRRPAPEAVLRVRGMLQRRPRLARVVDPEPERALPTVGEIGDDRVVGVHDERRLVGKVGDRRPPPLGDDLELAVPVELIAEEVRDRATTRGRVRSIASGSAASSTSKRPRSARPRRRARTRPRRGGSPRHDSRRGGGRDRGCARPSRSSSSSRSWLTRAPRPATTSRRARRPLRDRASRRACREASSRRRARPPARARPRHSPPASPGRGALPSAARVASGEEGLAL